MRLFRHPVHPMLVAFPIALLALTPVWDVLAWAGVMKDGRTTAYYSEAAGLIAAGLAAIAGFADLIKIPQSETDNGQGRADSRRARADHAQSLRHRLRIARRRRGAPASWCWGWRWRARYAWR